MLAIDEYHKKTLIRLREYDPLNDRDYVHITGENSGCWSYVGRVRGVSNTVKSVVRNSPALQTAPLRFCSFSQTKHKFTQVYHVC